MALGRKTLLPAALCALAWGQTGLTTIQDTLYKADGTRFNGTITIQWSTFDANSIGTIVQQSKTVQVLNGNLLVQLVPNATAVPPANVYTVNYQSDGSQQFTETWTVPAAAGPLTVPEVRIGTQTSPPGSGGSTSGSTTIPESSVVGLQADLAQRPLKGVGYGTNSVAVVDDSGNLETAVGDPGECVFVDGTTGPCGSPTYSDAETPGGTLDGVNNTFTLAYAPLGSSLMLFRNGIYLTANLDYALLGSTITFVSAATPQPGDILIASYRVDTSASSDIGGFTTGGSTTALQTAAAQVICGAPGIGTGATTWTSLGACDISAAALNAGDRIELRFTLAHTGGTSGFNFRVNWGSSTILARSGSSQDTALAGRADAGLSASSAQVGVESWGTVLPFLPGILGVPLQSGVEVTFQAALAAIGPDTVILTNFTVLRYPAN